MIRNCGVPALLKQLTVKEKGKGAKGMVKHRELRSKCEECDKRMMQNENKVCDECDKQNRCEMGTSNDNIEQEGNETCNSESDKVTKKNEGKKKNLIGQRLKEKQRMTKKKEQ